MFDNNLIVYFLRDFSLTNESIQEICDSLEQKYNLRTSHKLVNEIKLTPSQKQQLIINRI